MAWSDVLKAIIPIVVAALAWLLGQVASFSERLTKIEGQMPALITRGGVDDPEHPDCLDQCGRVGVS